MCQKTQGKLILQTLYTYPTHPSLTFLLPSPIQSLTVPTQIMHSPRSSFRCPYPPTLPNPSFTINITYPHTSIPFIPPSIVSTHLTPDPYSVDSTHTHVPIQFLLLSSLPDHPTVHTSISPVPPSVDPTNRTLPFPLPSHLIQIGLHQTKRTVLFGLLPS